jgi:hypothetical protein
MRKELRKSHILPEFFYVETYDEKHRAIQVTSQPGEKEMFIQKGEREKLLCGDCELHISKFESYSAPIIKSIPTLPADRTGKFLITPNVDYKLFKLFQMSLLWRASISTSQMFAQVKLGKQEEHLRKMILANKPGMSHNFGCVMHIFQNASRLKQIIWSPEKDNVEGKYFYRFQTGNIYWSFFITSFPKDHPMRNRFLTQDGNLPIIIASQEEEEIIQWMIGLIAQKDSQEAKE